MTLIRVVAGVALAVIFQPVAGPSPDVIAHFKSAQEPLGGSAAIAGVKSLAMSGTVRHRNQAYGTSTAATQQTIDTPFETKIMFPDRFIEWTDHGSSRSARGFSETLLLNRVESKGAGKVGAYYPPDMLRQEQAALGYLVLGLMLRTDTAFPFTLTGGDETTLSFRSATGIEVFVDLEIGTRRPTRIRYEAPEMSMNGTKTGSGPTVIELGDYRQVDGLTLPHRLTTSHRGRVESDRTINRIEINPTLARSEFER